MIEYVGIIQQYDSWVCMKVGPPTLQFRGFGGTSFTAKPEWCNRCLFYKTRNRSEGIWRVCLLSEMPTCFVLTCMCINHHKSSYADKQVNKFNQTWFLNVFNKLGGILLEYMIYVRYTVRMSIHIPRKRRNVWKQTRIPCLPGNCLRSRALSPSTCATTLPQGQKPLAKGRSRSSSVFQASKRSIERYCYWYQITIYTYSII